ncbi:16S rRNA (cytosine(1402)-N(4))-methyltransferase RsmH [Psychroflexus sp. ALD_RP9]|uniref:16S rRNA (cytosine(1402)-N(4))-methyltransferase RsmH n=1 Tax=Psychroflexus sp. ALD_RP9 TaxID=2777186 RepID=UPI001A8C085A|nr:16S rRNA (cytosine(1402)-N(4))-methyltransferase RsmH [Psychroflexus sp. ALD_RP9]QSS96500.1 16S rRNA (cytosine(1402)-N(4))-methyltransferase RsmH [Psychroflexus sp. ALD_RP9]
MNTKYHIPVLLKQSVDALVLNPDGVYVDATFGGGGHSAEILSRLSAKGRLFAFDQDKDAQQNGLNDDRFELIEANFRYLKRFLKFFKINEVDGILADFGVSSHQFDVPERGFSTRFDAQLDMRMNQNDKLSAYELINSYEEQDLIKLFRTYGELKMAPKLARAIISERLNKPIETTSDLNSVIEPLLPKTKVFKFLAQIYQAIRIEVNQEMKALEEFLLQTQDLVKPLGRLSFITYHSLEDRLVKRYIRDGNFTGQVEKDFYGNKLAPFKKVGQLIIPDKSEITENSRARSAKLRIAEKI